MKTAANKLIMVGRVTMLAVGLAVTLALMLGITTAALAAVPGNPFKLGQVNLINTISVLGGNTNNAMMRLINNSEGSNATGLNIQVKPNRPPMTVNSSTEVQGLNVDQVDSLSASAFLQESSDRDDFFSGRTYTELGQVSGPGTGAFVFVSAFCDPGDIAMGGGGADAFPIDDSNRFVESSPSQSDPRRWDAQFVDEGDGDIFRAFVRCADFPPLR